MTVIPKERIEQGILLLRGQKVMLDKDLAVLYGVKPIVLRQQVKRNQMRFPADFMLHLTEKEAAILVSQNVIPSRRSLGGHRPYAFTEQGVAMLSSVLRSDRAIRVNIEIMRTFARLRKMLQSHKNLWRKICQMEKHYDQQFRVVFDALRQLLNPPEKAKRQIGFHT